MAIDRAPWNALVDDDGSNLIGSVWNKAAIKTVLLDPVDAAIGGAWSVVPFNVANFWTGVTAAHITINNKMQIHKTVWWMVQIVGAPAPPATPYLPLVLPIPAGGLFNTNAVLGAVGYAADAGGPTGAVLFAGSPTVMNVAKWNFANWSGNCSAYFTATIGTV